MEPRTHADKRRCSGAAPPATPRNAFFAFICVHLRFQITEGIHHAFRRVDVLHRLLDDFRRIGPGARGTRLRIRLGSRALAYPDLAALAMGRRWRTAEAVRRRDGSIRDPHRGGDGDEDAETRHRRLPGEPARHDPDRQAGRLDRPGLRRALPVRHRHRLECRGDGGPRHGVRHPRQAGARAHRGDEGDLDQIEGRVSWRAGQLPRDDGLAEAGAEAAPADHRRRRLSAGGAACRALWRRLDSAGRPTGPGRRRVRVRAEVPRDAEGGRARRGILSRSRCSVCRRMPIC